MWMWDVSWIPIILSHIDNILGVSAKNDHFSILMLAEMDSFELKHPVYTWRNYTNMLEFRYCHR